uniref:Uncharacterized protein n=1 Tax=Timema tahoe TaxID=61484 RepID=A0A7R9ILA4_9NEOP|nr:unnamed protein product [Timema tahoe]
METVEEDSYSTDQTPTLNGSCKGLSVSVQGAEELHYVTLPTTQSSQRDCAPDLSPGRLEVNQVGVYVKWLQSVLAPLEPPTLKNTTEGEVLIQHLHF